MAYFPFFIDIEGADGLIIGSGKHAQEKIEKLVSYGSKLRVVEEFQESDLESRPDFVIIACDDMEKRGKIVELCRERQILINSVDDIENCDFVFPSLIHRGKLSVGIMTSGASPGFGMDLKKQIEEWLPDNIEEILEWMEMIRPEMKEKYPDMKERAKVFRVIYESMVRRRG